MEESGCFFDFPLISLIFYLFLLFFEGQARFCRGGPYFLVWEMLLVCQDATKLPKGENDVSIRWGSWVCGSQRESFLGAGVLRCFGRDWTYEVN